MPTIPPLIFGGETVDDALETIVHVAAENRLVRDLEENNFLAQKIGDAPGELALVLGEEKGEKE